MHFKRALFAAAVAAVAKSEVHTVEVGDEGLDFNPPTLSVKKGDTVIFHLNPVHDVVFGSFDKPCESDDSSAYSGSYDQSDDGNKKYVVNVTSEDPVYYYCSVSKHCQGGMVGGWNLPSSGKTLEAYGSAAKSVKKSTAPSGVKGGVLMGDDQIKSLTEAGPSAASSGAPSSSAPAPSASASATAPVPPPKPSGSAPAPPPKPSESAAASGPAPSGPPPPGPSPKPSGSAAAGPSGTAVAPVSSAAPATVLPSVPSVPSFTGAAESLNAGAFTGIIGVAIGVAAGLL